MTINLLVIGMPNFDVIFSIDFLSKYGIEINYRKKKVWFNLNIHEKFTFGEVEFSV